MVTMAIEHKQKPFSARYGHQNQQRNFSGARATKTKAHTPDTKLAGRKDKTDNTGKHKKEKEKL